jgi:hypothetical protein
MERNLSMKRLLLKLAIGAGLVSSLAACNSDNNNTATATPPPTPVTPTPLRFAALGTGFATDFAASANTEPVAVTAADVTAVNNTSEPSAVS